MAEVLSTGSGQTSDALLWVDCEFTGLSISEGHKIIEIGALVTDLALHELDAYQSFVRYDWQYIKDHMDKNPWWDGRTEDRDRMRAGQASAKYVTEVDSNLAELVAEHFGETKPPLCGNSVSNDKKHIEAQMPNFARKLHYQIIDVSSLKLVASKYRGVEYGVKAHKHYALEDIRESVDEFRFLLKALNVVKLG